LPLPLPAVKPVAEKKPAAVKPAPVVEKPAPVLPLPLPAVKPVAEKPAAVKPAPVVEKPAPVLPLPLPAVKPVAEKPAAVKPAPVVAEKPAPVEKLPPAELPAPNAVPPLPALPALPAIGGETKAPPPLALPPLPAKTQAPAKAGMVDAPPPVAPKAEVGKLARALTYEKNKTDLSDAAKSELADIAATVKQSQGSVRVVAYAGGTAEEASVAKRTSLARALQVRAYLITKGVNQLNISVQALGNNVPGGNPERADIFLK
ncbi:MAG: OmpA family protein, partial [Alphaproteobacteria bacterium]|nr:OmpA family protein [Alphaproteobacteria bacterium]